MLTYHNTEYCSQNRNLIESAHLSQYRIVFRILFAKPELNRKCSPITIQNIVLNRKCSPITIQKQNRNLIESAHLSQYRILFSNCSPELNRKCSVLTYHNTEYCSQNRNLIESAHLSQYRILFAKPELNRKCSPITIQNIVRKTGT